MIGVRVDGHKLLVAVADGYRESAEPRADLLAILRTTSGNRFPREVPLHQVWRRPPGFGWRVVDLRSSLRPEGLIADQPGNVCSLTRHPARAGRQ